MKTKLKTLTLPALLILALGSAAVLAQTATPGNSGAMPMQGRALERFKAADADGDGALSKEEAQRGMPRLAERFAALDTNQDGKISADEMQTMRNNMRGAGRPDGAGAGAGGMRHAAMRGGGKAGAGCVMGEVGSDGRIIRASVEKMGRPAALSRFDALDTDKDGVLSASERAACPMNSK